MAPPSGPGDDADDDPPRIRRASRGDLTDRCVSVLLGGETYGIPIRDVQEIIGARPLSRVFRAPPAVAGVTSLRGEILPVLDLAVLLGCPAAPPGPGEARIVVAREASGARRRAGLRVDALGPVRELPAGERGLAAPPVTLAARLRPFVRGLLGDAPICAVLDVGQLFDAPELAALAGRGGAAHGPKPEVG